MYIIVWLLLIVGLFECPLTSAKSACSLSFDNLRELIHHARIHGPEYFPWVCGVCPLKNNVSSPYFISSSGMIAHWEAEHPEIVDAEDIVHPNYGNHFSCLPFTFRKKIKFE